MAIKILENGFISDSFEMGEGVLLYKDALIMSPKEYEALAPEQIEALKQARYANWLAIIQAPPVDTPQDG